MVYLQSWTPTVRSLDLLSVRILDPCCLSECSDSRTSQKIVPTPLGHIYENLNMPPLSPSASVWYANSLLRPKIRRRDLTVTTSTIDSQRSLQTGDPRDVVAYCVTSHKGSRRRILSVDLYTGTQIAGPASISWSGAYLR